MTTVQDNGKGFVEAHKSAAGDLRVVKGAGLGGGLSDPLPQVRLRREFKGLTVADLQRDEILSRLPGQVRSVLEHVEEGNYAAAERVLPGSFGNVLVGPGHRARSRWRWVATLAIIIVATVWTIARGLTS